MKNGIKNRIAKRWIVCWITVVSLALAGLAAYAAYTNLNSVKRVVSTQGGNGIAFSSNYLNLTSAQTQKYNLKSIYFAENSETTVFEINVCNYVHNDPSKVNENDITYSLTLTLVKPDGTAVTDSFPLLAVTYGDTSMAFTNGVCTAPARTMAGGVKCVDTYRITVPKEFMNTVNISAVAAPDSVSYQYTDNKKLGREFTFSVRNASVTTWTGGFIETTADGYDGFNYVIKGQGKGTVTLVWDNENLEISKVFLENNGLSAVEMGKKTVLTIEVDSNVNNRYEIQFYKRETGIYTDMETVNGYVDFGFMES